MHTVSIPQRHKDISFPSEIAELSPDKYLEFVRLMLRFQAGEIDGSDFRTSLVVALLDIKIGPKFLRMQKDPRQNEICLSIYDNIRMLADACDSFFTIENRDGKEVKILNTQFTKNLLPSIGNLFGPSDELFDATFYEYRTAHDHYREYATDPENVDALNRLIATLYRPKKRFLCLLKKLNSFDGQERIRITAKSNPVIFEKRVKKISALPFHVKYAVFLWFHNIEEFIHSGEIEVSGTKLNFKDLYAKPENEKEDKNAVNLGWIGILYGLSETKNFGSMEETDNSNFYDVLILLYKNMMAFKALKTNDNGTN